MEVGGRKPEVRRRVSECGSNGVWGRTLRETADGGQRTVGDGGQKPFPPVCHSEHVFLCEESGELLGGRVSEYGSKGVWGRTLRKTADSGWRTAGDGGQNSEVRRQRPEDRGQKSEVRRRVSECGSKGVWGRTLRKTADSGRRTAGDGGQMSEDRNQMPEKRERTDRNEQGDV